MNFKRHDADSFTSPPIYWTFNFIPELPARNFPLYYIYLLSFCFFSFYIFSRFIIIVLCFYFISIISIRPLMPLSYYAQRHTITQLYNTIIVITIIAITGLVNISSCWLLAVVCCYYHEQTSSPDITLPIDSARYNIKPAENSKLILNARSYLSVSSFVGGKCF